VFRTFIILAVLFLFSPASLGQSTGDKTTKPASQPSAAPTPYKIGDVEISGSVRARFESWDWFDTDAADGDYNFGAATLRVGIGQTREKIEWLVEAAAPFFINLPENAIAPGSQGQLGHGASYFAANGRRDGSVILKQGFVRFKRLFGDAPSSLKIGRFEFSDGAETAPADPTLATLKRDRIGQRLIGAFGFTHIGRSFDGLIYARQTKNWNFTFVGARPTTGVFDLSANKELDVDFFYGALTKPLKFKSAVAEYRVFALHYHDGRPVVKTDNRPMSVREADKQNIRITSVGGHYLGAFNAGSGKLDLLVWAVGQFGSWGLLDQRSAALAVEGGYQPGGKAAAKYKPWIRAGYFRSTGDNDPTDGTNTTFFQVLPTPRIYARFPIYNLMNNEDSFVQFTFKPHPRWAIRGDIHHLRLSSRQDLWYLGGGAFQKNSFGYVGRPSNGANTFGTLFDVSVDYQLASKSSFTFYLAGIKGGGVPARIYPLGSNTRYAYIEFNQKF
jgi:hypothetical protein